MNRQDGEQLTVPPDGRPEAEQPRWRQDFPIDSPQDEYVARRDFVKFMVLISLAFTTGQFWVLWRNARRAPAEVLPLRAIARVDDIAVGGALVFAYPEPGDARVLVRLDAQTMVAYAQHCTHLSCPVIPQPEAGRLYCPCHEGSFDLATGRAIAGPPQRPLPRVTLQVRDGVIYATGVEERSV
jgi:Rieske Fe-S protein